MPMDFPPEEFLQALARREPLRAGNAHGPTDALRLLDGRGDGPEFAGLILEDLAGRWLAHTSAPDAALPEWLRNVRPAPRAIYWKHLDVSDKRPPEPWHGERVDAPFEVRENGLRYRLDFAAGYSQGLFLDQRDNRAAVRARAAPGRTVLNLFAYTCGFSVAAAAAGAHTVSGDLSNASLTWGRENFRLNGLDPAAHEFLATSVADALEHAERKGRRFDVIVLDPPSFSRDRSGRVFRAGRDLGPLAARAARLRTPGGGLLVTTNLRALPPGGLRRSVVRSVENSRSMHWSARSVGMPPDFTGEPYLQTVWLAR